MYLGLGESRARQLDKLAGVLTGYALALHLHRAGGEDLGVLEELRQSLRQRSGAVDSCGIDEILATSRDDSEAWKRVWALIDEFRAMKGHTL